MTLELKSGRKIKYNEYYEYSGVHISIMEPVTPDEKEEIKKTLKSERDLVSLKFRS